MRAPAFRHVPGSVLRAVESNASVSLASRFALLGVLIVWCCLEALAPRTAERDDSRAELLVAGLASLLLSGIPLPGAASAPRAGCFRAAGAA